jgi:hypothetical protein
MCLAIHLAQMVESVDTQDLKSCGHPAVRVRVPLRAQNFCHENWQEFFLF